MNLLLSLPDLVKEFKIHDTYGASVACKTLDASHISALRDSSITSNSYVIMTLLDGTLDFTLKGTKFRMDKRCIISLPPYYSVRIAGRSGNVRILAVMIEDDLYREVLNPAEPGDGMAGECLRNRHIFYPDTAKMAEMEYLYSQICRTMHSPHLYGDSILRSLLRVYLLVIAGMQYGTDVIGHDIKHKENIFRIFMHIASTNFRKERQVKFYADKMNITTTYLSRVVKEVSGNTVLNYLSMFLYNEACKLLKTTDMTIAEISRELNFSDPPAFTNYFKSKAGMTPLAYRNEG